MASEWFLQRIKRSEDNSQSNTPRQQPAPQTPTSSSVSGFSDYEIRETLGTGTFGKVKLGVHRVTGHTVAIKCIKRAQIDAQQIARLQREIRILTMLRHENVILLYQVIHTPKEILMVMEHVNGGDLLDHINSRGPIAEVDGRSVFMQVVEGLRFCHSLGVAHRDLKPENILLDHNAKVKIADFGLSNIMDPGGFLKTLCGSPYYASPELLGGPTTYDARQADIWSVGVILYAMLCGELPFQSDTLPKLFQKIKDGSFTLPKTHMLSPEAVDLISKMLVVNPQDRYNAAQILAHDWCTLVIKKIPKTCSMPLDGQALDKSASITRAAIPRVASG